MSDTNNNIPELLIRLDERTRNISSEINSLRTDQKDKLDILTKNIKEVVDSNEKKVARLDEELKQLRTDIEKNYVRKDTFMIVRNIVFSVVALILTTVVIAMIRTVINQNQ